jgi:hypothetical protein
MRHPAWRAVLPLGAAPLFHRWHLASQPENFKGLRETNRQVRDALKDCHDLLERTRQLLRRTGQDNDRQLSH